MFGEAREENAETRYGNPPLPPLLFFCAAETFSSTLTSEEENSGMGGIAMLTLSDTENNLHFILILQGLIQHRGKGKEGAVQMTWMSRFKGLQQSSPQNETSTKTLSMPKKERTVLFLQPVLKSQALKFMLFSTLICLEGDEKQRGVIVLADTY